MQENLISSTNPCPSPPANNLAADLNKMRFDAIAEVADRAADFASSVADAADAGKLLGVGDAATPKDLPVPELAAWTSVARVILNLHETITRM